MKKILKLVSIALLAAGLEACSSSSQNTDSGNTPDSQASPKSQGGPRAGGPGMGGGHRPAPSAALQAVIDETVPYFKQFTYIDEKNDTLMYNLFTPQNIEAHAAIEKRPQAITGPAASRMRNAAGLVS